MNNIEEIYDQALEMLKQGHPQEEVLVKFASVRNELAPLLSLSAPLLTIPKNIVPTPLMSRKYAAVAAKSFWLVWTKISKFAAVALGLMLIMSALGATGYAAGQSGPGQALFGLKKGAEQLQLIFATSQNEKASLQVAIAQKRLDEAQAIFSNPASAPEQKSAALQELSSQTSSAVAEVNTVAINNPSSDQNHPLVNSLTSITKAQASLLAQINPGNSQVQTAANNAQVALNKTSAQLSQISQTLAVADSDQALATLNADPNSVAVLGRITKLRDNQVTVEQTTFTLTTETIIQNSAGTILSVHDLALNQQVSIIGLKNTGFPVAKQILISKDQQPAGSVQGASTTTPSSATSTPTTLPKPTDTQTPPSTTTPSSSAIGSFILESPSPQFAN